MSQQKIIILDRDGVINIDSDEYIKSPEEWVAIPQSLEAIVKLKQAGYLVVIATNQSGISRGFYTHAILDQIHHKMQTQLLALDPQGIKIDGIFYCPHGPDKNCDCRKPKAGLFKQIADKFQVSLQNIPAIGDSLRDCEAAIAVGCEPILVLTGKGKDTISKNPDFFSKIKTFPDLMSATLHLLAPD